jgi:hypothetical protein
LIRKRPAQLEPGFQLFALQQFFRTATDQVQRILS